MQFHVAQLLKEHTGAVRRFEMNEPIRQLGSEDMTIEAPLTGEVSLMRDTDGILVTGHVQTEVSVPCARCLEPVTVPVEMDLEEQYYPTIDVETGHKVPVPEDADTDTLLGSGRTQSRGTRGAGRGGRGAMMADTGQVATIKGLPASDLANLIQELTEQMHQAAAELKFEVAARLRDEVKDLKKELRQMSDATR